MTSSTRPSGSSTKGSSNGSSSEAQEGSEGSLPAPGQGASPRRGQDHRGRHLEALPAYGYHATSKPHSRHPDDPLDRGGAAEGAVDRRSHPRGRNRQRRGRRQVTRTGQQIPYVPRDPSLGNASLTS